MGNYPEIEARVSEKRALIKIHSDKRRGLLVKILAEVQKLDLVVLNTNVVPFGTFALDITITAQVYNIIIHSFISFTYHFHLIYSPVENTKNFDILHVKIKNIDFFRYEIVLMYVFCINFFFGILIYIKISKQ